MTESTKQSNLAQKIAQIMVELEPVEKTGKVEFGKTKYNYVKAETLFATLQKKLGRAGIIVVPSIEEITHYPNGGLFMGRGIIRLINVDDTADVIEFPWHAAASSSDDKGPNKIGTSMLKYALMKLFLISDEEDPDAEVFIDKKLLAEVEMVWADVPDADRSKLSKTPREMSNEELTKALPWLRKHVQQS